MEDDASQRTDESGLARFERLAGGRYTAIVSCTYQVDELEVPVYLPMLKHEFDLSEQHIKLRIPDALLRLQPARGRLVDTDGNGLGARALRLRTDVFPGPTSMRAPTDGRGSFRFAGLAAGRYTLELVDGEKVVVVGEFTVVGDRAEDLGELTVR